MPRPKLDDGLTNEARYRARHPERCRRSAKAWQKKHPEWYRNEYRKIRDRQVGPLMKEQKGLCAICDRKMEHPYRDHNHACCSVVKRGGCPKCRRGLLCPSCNGGLHLIENPKLHKAAVAYLRKWRA